MRLCICNFRSPAPSVYVRGIRPPLMPTQNRRPHGAGPICISAICFAFALSLIFEGSSADSKRFVAFSRNEVKHYAENYRRGMSVTARIIDAVAPNAADTCAILLCVCGISKMGGARLHAIVGLAPTGNSRPGAASFPFRNLHVHPAVDRNHLAGDVGRLRAGQECDCCRDFFRFSETSKRRHRAHLLLHRIR